MSVGSGQLLFDLEVVERIRALGVKVARICLIDRAYRKPRIFIKRALREFADWQRAATQLVKHESTEVLVFGSLRDFYEVAGDGQRIGCCHLMLHCDADWDGAAWDCERLAVRALVPGGLLARLTHMPGDNRRCGFAGPFYGDELAEEEDEDDIEEEEDDDLDMLPGGASFVSAAWTLVSYPPELLKLPTLKPIEDPLLSRLVAAVPLQAPSFERWRVVHSPKVAVRAKPRAQGEVVDVFNTGDEVVVTGERQGPWLRVHASSWRDPLSAPIEAWVLSDGTSVGLGVLLEPI